MFVKLTGKAREFLINFAGENSEKIGVAGLDDYPTIEYLQKCGYVNRVSKHVGQGYHFHLTYEGMNYEELEKVAMKNNPGKIENNYYGSQVNNAYDHATINATQNNNLDLSQLNEIIENILTNAPKENIQEFEKTKDCLEIIKKQLLSPTPAKDVLSNKFSILKSIKGTIEFGAAVTTLVQLVATAL